MKRFYLIRLDDACPTMDVVKWDKIEKMLDKYHIKPMVGIVPANNDYALKIDKYDDNFWEKVKSWEDKNWTIALHGFDHSYISKDGGINPLWERSEFAGVSIEKQKDKIKKGIRILTDKNIVPKYFFAPSHTFDLNTLEALESESMIRIISDTIAFKPYSKYGFVFIPQQFGSLRDVKLGGYWTYCLHPNTMFENEFLQLEHFLSKNYASFISFEEVPIDGLKDRDLFEKMLNYIYFFLRKIRK